MKSGSFVRPVAQIKDGLDLSLQLPRISESSTLEFTNGTRINIERDLPSLTNCSLILTLKGKKVIKVIHSDQGPALLSTNTVIMGQRSTTDMVNKSQLP